jgi:hypothetical protein
MGSDAEGDQIEYQLLSSDYPEDTISLDETEGILSISKFTEEAEFDLKFKVVEIGNEDNLYSV